MNLFFCRSILKIFHYNINIATLKAVHARALSIWAFEPEIYAINIYYVMFLHVSDYKSNIYTYI